MRPDRVLFPASGFTKNAAMAYYEKVAPILLPHLKNVPVSFKRYPDTIRGESFWEKDAPSFTPKWVKTVAVPRRGADSNIHYILINDLRTLRWIVDVGGIEIHPFLHRTPHIERATAMVFDLDPGEGASIIECCEVALLLRDALGAIELQSFAKVSGSKGLQVYVPLKGTDTHESTESFAHFIADELARAHPKLIVSNMAKQLRAGKVFIDWSQNADFKTTIAAYSLRTKRELPYVAMPVTWQEVERAKNLDFSPEEAVQRVHKDGDLFEPILKSKQRLPVEDRRPRLSGSGRASGSRTAAPSKGQTGPAALHGETVALPRPKSQSGRRLFVLPKTDTGDELWLEMRGKFRRWILRPDREGGPQLIAMPAGDFKVDASYFRGEVPAQWRKRVKIEDTGSYEIIDGSYARRRFDLYFSGKTLQGEWVLEKLGDESHRSWSLTPARSDR